MTLRLPEIRDRYGSLVDERLQAALSTATDDLLRTMSTFHLGTGGKRLRALIPIWIAVVLGRNGEDALDVGVALELLHNGTLVHDDLQDGDTIRRGQPTVWQRWGAAQAINAGDALYFQGLAWLAKTAAGPDLAGTVSQALLRVVEGQVAEFRMQLPDSSADALEATPDAWEAMARSKTGALFGICYQAGVVVAGGDDDQARAAGDYGESIGLLFQVQDDLLDLVGDKGRGRRGSDIAEGKLSFPAVWAYSHADDVAVRRLQGIIRTPRGDTSDEMVGEALEMLGDSGAIDATIAWIRAEAKRLREAPSSGLTPGFVDEILAPIHGVL